jgi:hypothetical protein
MYRHNGLVAGRELMEPLEAACAVTLAFEYITKASEPLALNSVIEIGGIPPNCVVSDAFIVFEDLDSGAAASVDIGVLSGTYGRNDDTRTVGQQFAAANTAAPRSGGLITATAAALLLDPATQDRGVGIKFVAAPATQVNGAKIRAFITCVQTGAKIT